MTVASQRETGFLETNGGRIYYEVEGSGEPVVLIHAGIANLRMWDVTVPALADAYRVIRYDTRGYGRTETQDVPFSNRADIADLLAYLGEDAAHVIGMSRAGSIALDFALEFPDRVRSLVVGAGGISGYQADVEPGVDWDEVERWWEAKEWERLADFETAYWVDGPGQPTDRVDAALRGTVHDWILSNYRVEKVEGQPQVLQPPAIERLGELRAPLLILIGELDDPSTNASMRHLAERVPTARVEVFAGAAHMINMEQPDRFNRVVREFLDANRT